MDKLAANNLAAWLACLFFLIAGMNALMKFWRNLKGKESSPPNEQLEVGRRELERRISATERELVDLRKEWSHEREASDAASRQGRAGIYNKIEEVREQFIQKVDELAGEVAKQFQDTERALGRIEGKLDK